MLGKMIEEALAAEQKAAEMVAQAKKTASQREQDFDTQALLELKNTEERARAQLRQIVENARKDNEAVMKNELQRIYAESDNFLGKNENLITEATRGVCNILSRPAYQVESR